MSHSVGDHMENRPNGWHTFYSEVGAFRLGRFAPQCSAERSVKRLPVASKKRRHVIG